MCPKPGGAHAPRVPWSAPPPTTPRSCTEAVSGPNVSLAFDLFSLIYDRGAIRDMMGQCIVQQKWSDYFVSSWFNRKELRKPKRVAMAGQVMMGKLREVEVEELLDRAPVEVNTERIRQTFSDRVVLVTGAAGSVGSELCRQIAGFNPRRLLLVDQSVEVSQIE